MIQITFTWVNGQKHVVKCIGTETLEEILEHHGFLSPDRITRLFFNGKELPLQLSTGIFNPSKQYKIVVYQKEIPSATPRVRVYPRSPVAPDQKVKQLMMKEGARITDNFYNHVMNQHKSHIQFQKSYQAFIEKQNTEDVAIPTFINYESKLSEAPLPVFFEPTPLSANPTSSDKDDLLDHIDIPKKPNGDASQV